MQEIPTYHAQPLTPACDHWCPFPVADRPNAVRQFFEAAARDPSLIQAPWILLIETDYVWMKPLQNVPTAESSSPGWAFQYGYIMPTYPSTSHLLPPMLSHGCLCLLDDSQCSVQRMCNLHMNEFHTIQACTHTVFQRIFIL
jgi:hypothetical protein